MGKKFDAAALASVAQGLKEEEIPFDVREFRRSLDTVIRSIEDLGANPHIFAQSHNDPDDPTWKIASHLSKKSVRSCEHAFTELRTLRNRLKRLRLNQHSTLDASVIIGLSDFICQAEIFVEAA
ncbi:MAG: hypothetical protein KGJ31_03555 [Patescibacteria group bacterium]|nr:hypothetical protein [Patescibacteria group bacterium]